MSRKAIVILTIILIVAVAGLSVLGVSLAVWRNTTEAGKNIEMSRDEYDPSHKYLVYEGLDSHGDVTDVAADITSYAVVGYGEGGGLVGEVVIPSTHEGKPVTEVRVGTGDNYPYRFNGNSIITSITIPASVTRVAAGACANMLLLAEVTFTPPAEGQSAATVRIEDFAFANCANLRTFSCTRAIDGVEENYIFGTPVLNE